MVWTDKRIKLLTEKMAFLLTFSLKDMKRTEAPDLRDAEQMTKKRVVLARKARHRNAKISE